MALASGLIEGSDGKIRCWWPGTDGEYMRYHDHEWGNPVIDDTRLFEKICLEGFQSGLSWLTILRKRENFRNAFAGFDMETIAAFGDADAGGVPAGGDEAEGAGFAGLFHLEYGDGVDVGVGDEEEFAIG